MSELPTFVVAPPIRCFHRHEDHELAPCGQGARWIRWRKSVLPQGYFCDRHRAPGDEPILAEPLIRRVSVSLEVLFSATNWIAEPGQVEAVARLERAVESAGGVINLHAVTSVIGRCAGWPSPCGPIAIRSRA